AATPVRKASGERGRLIFAMDATASRQATWDRACHIQSEMFMETASLGGLDVQLTYYRGFGEFEATTWTSDSSVLLKEMTSVYCLAGESQLSKVLSHAITETKKTRVDALVFVGDCLEEDVDRLGRQAGELGLLGVPAFMFHEGDDPVAAYGFQQIAKLTNGACCSFDAHSAQALKELLKAVAVYAAGGRKALESYASKRGGTIKRITDQMRR
ncbi:MAG: VWA domain-containing protein, partial [Alphaproteobacteria bacterium]|nr:VWA domain-containing protein [Alphaproteobacteria bacterium]